MYIKVHIGGYIGIMEEKRELLVRAQGLGLRGLLLIYASGIDLRRVPAQFKNLCRMLVRNICGGRSHDTPSAMCTGTRPCSSRTPTLPRLRQNVA